MDVLHSALAHLKEVASTFFPAANFASSLFDMSDAPDEGISTCATSPWPKGDPQAKAERATICHAPKWPEENESVHALGG